MKELVAIAEDERERDRDKSKVESVANVVKFTSSSQWKLLKEQVKIIF